MFIVYPRTSHSRPVCAIIPIHHIVRGAHLIPVYHESDMPDKLEHFQTLDHFSRFYVNKYIDYHAFELAV